MRFTKQARTVLLLVAGFAAGSVVVVAAAPSSSSVNFPAGFTSQIFVGQTKVYDPNVATGSTTAPTCGCAARSSRALDASAWIAASRSAPA